MKQLVHKPTYSSSGGRAAATALLSMQLLVSPMMGGCNKTRRQCYVADKSLEAQVSELGDVNARDQDGRTALMWAIKKEQMEIAKMLRACGAKER